METETGKEITSPGRPKATRSKAGTTGDVYKAEQGSGLEPGRESATTPSEADRDDLRGEKRTADSAGDTVREPGRRTVERWEELTEKVDRTVNENPMTAALTALGVGLVIGLVVGVLVARD